MSVKEIVGTRNLRRILLIFLFGAVSLHPSVQTALQIAIQTALQTAIRTGAAQRSKKVAKSSAQELGDTIKINSTLVAVPVSVIDATGQPVQNLRAEDFQLEEEGRTQQVVTLDRPGKSPIEIAILFDISGSVFDRFQFQRDAAMRFLREALKPNDAVSIFTIGIKPKLVQSRVVGAKKAVAAAMAITPTKEATSFFDTVVEAARYLNKTAEPGARRVIVAISDGEDMLSADYRLSDALRELQQSDCLFYSINPSTSAIRLNRISTRGQNDMISLASTTGGAAFLPDKPEDLDKMFHQITGDLQSQYLLSYYSTNDQSDGRYRRINVRVLKRPDFRLRARKGYYAPKA